MLAHLKIAVTTIISIIVVICQNSRSIGQHFLRYCTNYRHVGLKINQRWINLGSNMVICHCLPCSSQVSNSKSKIVTLKDSKVSNTYYVSVTRTWTNKMKCNQFRFCIYLIDKFFWSVWNTLAAGVHFSLDVLLSWADRGSCAHKCVC